MARKKTSPAEDAEKTLGTGPEGQDTVPEGQDTVPEGRDAVPEGRDAVPEGRDAVLEDQDAILDAGAEEIPAAENGENADGQESPAAFTLKAPEVPEDEEPDGGTGLLFPEEDALPGDGAREIVSVNLSAPLQPVEMPPASGDGLEEEGEDSPPDGEVRVPDEELIVAPPEPDEPKKSDRQKFFELKFNELDRRLTPEERQEWNSIYASYRGRSALTGTIIGIDPYSVNVWNRQAETMEKQTMYCAIVVPYRVRIVIPATEMWEEGRERPEFVMQNMVGSTISFIIIKVDRESGFAIASRRLASKARRYYFDHRPALNTIGARIKCNILSVGPRRCLVECYGHDINVTQREMRYTAIPDLRDEYHPGQELDCIVKVYDPETGRLEISIKETGANPFDGAELRHPVGSRRQAMIAGKYGGGVFCNLPDGTVCMCNYSYQHDDSDFLVGDTVILVVQRYEVEKRQMYGKILSKW